MKFYCQRTELNRALNTVLPAVSSRTPSKILEGILAEVKDGFLKITATDTNMTIETFIKVNSDQDVSFVIPAKLFTSIIAKLPEEDVMLTYTEENTKLKIKSGNSQSEIICFSADNFPKFIIDEQSDVIELEKETLKRIIKKTAFSASADELNGVLTGVLIEIKDGSIKMVAADAFRISMYTAQADTKEIDNIIIPAKMIKKLEKIISEETDDKKVYLYIENNKAVFKFDNNRVIMNTLSGKYIDYERIIKRDHKIDVRVIRDDLVKAIDRASLLASSQSNNLIKINISDNLVQVSSLSEEGNIDEKVEVIKNGEDITIGFNSRYLMDVLRVIEDEEIYINLKDNISPCTIVPLSGEAYLYLVLPVRIS